MCTRRGANRTHAFRLDCPADAAQLVPSGRRYTLGAIHKSRRLCRIRLRFSHTSLQLPLALTKLSLSTGWEALLRATHATLQDQHVCVRFPASTRQVLDVLLAGLSLDEDGTADLADGVLDTGVQPNLRLLRYLAQMVRKMV